MMKTTNIPPVNPWQNWYICTGSTSGTWLPGDPRGWRTKRHRQHVEGDYCDRPADTKERRRFHEMNNQQLNQDAVYLNATKARSVAGEALAAKLSSDGIMCEVVAVCHAHYHALICVPDRRPRFWLGRAKKAATAALQKIELVTGRVWATKGQCKPIAEQLHWERARRYIEKHLVNEGAALWSAAEWDCSGTDS